MWGLRCSDCGRFMAPRSPGSAWAATGEFGEDVEWTCARCAATPAFHLAAGNGSTDPRWCGRVPAAAAP